MKSGRHRINNGRTVSYSSLRASNAGDADKVDPRTPPGSGTAAPPADANGSGPRGAAGAPGAHGDEGANGHAFANGVGHNGNGNDNGNGNSNGRDSRPVLPEPAQAVGPHDPVVSDVPAPRLEGF